MEKQYIIAFIWLAGFLLCWWMVKVDHEAEKKEFTNGDQVMCIIISVLSWGMIMFLLVTTWVAKVGAKGYWKRPVKNKKPE